MNGDRRTPLAPLSRGDRVPAPQCCVSLSGCEHGVTSVRPCTGRLRRRRFSLCAKVRLRVFLLVFLFLMLLFMYVFTFIKKFLLAYS